MKLRNLKKKVFCSEFILKKGDFYLFLLILNLFEKYTSAIQDKKKQKINIFLHICPVAVLTKKLKNIINYCAFSLKATLTYFFNSYNLKERHKKIPGDKIF